MERRSKRAKNEKKVFVVFGLGRFGRSIATTLADGGCEVMVIDKDPGKIQEMAEIVTYAMAADVTDVETMDSIGISNFDGAVVAIGQSLEASVMITIMAKELGVPYILAKAQTDIQGKVLKKVGANVVIYPEKEMGIRIAHNLLMGNFFAAVELSTTFSMMELDTLEKWDGYSLSQLDLRKKYKINVVGLKRNSTFDINPDPEVPLSKDDTLVVIGKNDILNKLVEMKKSE